MLAACAASGCHLSHERPTPADAPDASVAPRGERCRFAATPPGAARIECEVWSGSGDACAQAARCLCAGEPTPTARTMCAGWELTPRGAITFADVCALEAPASHTMREALAHYFREGAGVVIDDGCEDVPALIGRWGDAACAHLGGVACPCLEAPCDLDRALGRSCVDTSAATLECILAALPRDGTCAELAPIAASCAR